MCVQPVISGNTTTHAQTHTHTYARLRNKVEEPQLSPSKRIPAPEVARRSAPIAPARRRAPACKPKRGLPMPRNRRRMPQADVHVDVASRCSCRCRRLGDRRQVLLPQDRPGRPNLVRADGREALAVPRGNGCPDLRATRGHRRLVEDRQDDEAPILAILGIGALGGGVNQIETLARNWAIGELQTATPMTHFRTRASSLRGSAQDSEAKGSHAEYA